jgi:hypothetical protein
VKQTLKMWIFWNVVYFLRPIFKSLIVDYLIFWLTLNPLTWKIWWAPNNVRKWQMGFNSAFGGLFIFTSPILTFLCKFHAVCSQIHIVKPPFSLKGSPYGRPNLPLCLRCSITSVFLTSHQLTNAPPVSH